MKKIIIVFLLAVGLFCLASSVSAAGIRTLTSDQEVKVMNISIPWVENQGQIDNQNVRFSANTMIGTVFVTNDGAITYSLQSHEPAKEDNQPPELIPPFDSDPTPQDTPKVTPVVIKELPLYKVTPIITGEDPSPAKTNYFIGNDKSKWESNVSTYNLVSEGFIYPKIKLELKAHNNNIEKIYTVEPNGNPNNIKMSVDGASSLQITEDGGLKVTPSCDNVLPLLRGGAGGVWVRGRCPHLLYRPGCLSEY